MTIQTLAGVDEQGIRSAVGGFSAFDWLLIAILVWSTGLAFFRGILREVFALTGLIAGMVLAAWNYPLLAAKLARWITTPWTADIVAFVLIVLGISLLASLAGRLAKQTAATIGLGFFDRMAGAVFGLVRGCLLGVALMMSISAFLPPSGAIEKSQLAPYFLAGARGVCFVVPQDFKQQIADGASRIKHIPPGWIKPPR